MNKNNYIFYDKNFEYPTNPPYHPSVNYPEYPFLKKFICRDNNKVYDAIRYILKNLGLDEDNFNKPNWNPFKKLIKPGNFVVLKPNMVLHKHLNNLDINSVITHGSLIRAILDFVYIALKGNGTVVIGDAPIQSCIFNQVIEQNGCKSIASFYNNETSLPVELIDFRLTSAEIDSNNKINKITELVGDKRGYTLVDLGKDSILDEISHNFKRFRVTNYDHRIMRNHHNLEKHEYLIPNSILFSDVLINLPKPKTHKKAGLTASMKNLIGINGHKDYLPHHISGSADQNGDEYLHYSKRKVLYVGIQEIIDKLGIYGHYNIAKPLILLQKYFNRIFFKIPPFKDDFLEGSWWGNETISRTTVDLNRILLYADKKGKMQNFQSRNYFTLCDAIISGEGEGPMSPTPKKANFLLGGFNPLVTDLIISKLFGFDYQKIPTLVQGIDCKKYPLKELGPEQIILNSNNPDWNLKNITTIEKNKTLNYKPSKGWKGHIESLK